MVRLALLGLAPLLFALRPEYDVLATRPEYDEDEEDMDSTEVPPEEESPAELPDDSPEEPPEHVDAANNSPTQSSHRALEVIPEDVREQILTYFEGASGVLESVLSFFDGANVGDDDLAEAMKLLPTLLFFFDSDRSKQLVDDEKINLLSFMKLFAGDHIEINKELLQRMQRILAQFAGADNKLSIQEQEHLVIVLKSLAGGDIKLGNDELNNAEQIIKTFTGGDSVLDAEEQTHLVKITQYLTLDAKLALEDMKHAIATFSGRGDVFSKAEQERMLAKLREFDVDGSGHLSEHERKEFMKSLSPTEKAEDEGDMQGSGQESSPLAQETPLRTHEDDEPSRGQEEPLSAEDEVSQPSQTDREGQSWQAGSPVRQISIGIDVTVNGHRIPVK